MARNAFGTYTLPSSVNPIVSLTPVASAWANLTLNDVANEITLSLDRNGRGAMLAQLQLSSGAVGVPALGFSAESNSGLYRAGAGDLRVAVAGVDQLQLTASALTIAAALRSGDGTVAAPAHSFNAESGSGLYRARAGNVRMAISGADRATFSTKTSLAAATAATGGTRQDALSLTNGDLDLSGVAAPTSTTALTNRLTAAGIPKMWASITITNADPFVPSVDAGLNVASVSRQDTGSVLRVTFAAAMADANYVAWGYYMGSVGGVLMPVGAGGTVDGRTTAQVDFSAIDWAGSRVDLDSKSGLGGAGTMKLLVAVLAAQ